MPSASRTLNKKQETINKKRAKFPVSSSPRFASLAESEREEEAGFQFPVFKAGFTLVEVLIGLLLVGIISTIIFSIYFANFKLFTLQIVAIGTADQNRIAIDEIANTARQAFEAPVSCSRNECQSGTCSSSCTYPPYITNDSSHLVLKLWPLNVSGDPVEPTGGCYFDYVSYYLGDNPTAPTPTNPDADGTYHLTRETAHQSGACSTTRTQGKKIIATKLPIDGLSFQPIPYSLPFNEIKITIKTQGKTFFLPVPHTVTKTTSVRFKNRTP